MCYIVLNLLVIKKLVKLLDIKNEICIIISPLGDNASSIMIARKG